MRKFVKLCAIGVSAALLMSGCSTKDVSTADATETTTVSGGETTPTATETLPEDDVAEKGSIKLGNYKKLPLTRQSSVVTDEELEEIIQNELEMNPERIEVTDREVKDGDIVNIDYVGMKEGVAFDGGTAQAQDLIIGSNSFIPGFETGLVGAKIGDELSLDLTFPADYGNTDLAGAAVVFDVTINGISEEKDSVLDDAFVQRISEQKTVDEYRKEVRKSLEAEKVEASKMQLQTDAINAVIADSKIVCAEAEVQEQVDAQMESYTSMVAMYGMELEDYTKMFGMDLDGFKASLRADAKDVIKQQMVAEAIAEKEKFKVEAADRESIAADFAQPIEELNTAYGAEAVDNAAKMFKVINFVIDNAVITDAVEEAVSGNDAAALTKDASAETIKAETLIAAETIAAETTAAETTKAAR